MWNRAENQIEMYLIRHGSTVSNEEHRYLGQTEEPLSESGISKLQVQAGEWDPFAPELVFSSPLKRCRQSAQLLFPTVPVIVVPEWKEMNFGRFEGKNYVELNGDPDYQAWIDSGGRIAFPEGESREEFVRRTVEGMANVLELLSKQVQQKSCPACDDAGGICVAAVVHGGTIMALLSHYAGGDYYDYQVENGRGYHCRLRLRGDDVEMEIVSSFL